MAGAPAPRSGTGGPTKPRVVIVGAGFGGLTLARKLRRLPVRVLLLDAHNYHLFTPLLYQVASALLNPSEIAQPVRKLVRPVRNCQFRMAEVTGVDLDRRLVLTDEGPVEYEFLVLAAGSVNNYFGNQELERRSLALKSLPDALALRNWVLGRFEMASWEPDRQRRAELMTFAVVGGGSTGVEFAGSLMELIRLVLSRDYRGLDLSSARVILVEAGAEILGGFRPRLRRAAARSLTRRGVEIRVGSAVREILPDRLTLASGEELLTSSVVWTAGVRGAPVGGRLGMEPDRSGRLPVSRSLQLPGHPEVMVIGDLAALDDLPMLAQVAIQQAGLAARNIAAVLEGREPDEFQYRDLGIMATVGRNFAIAQIGPLQLAGFVGWVLWLVVHLANILTFRARLMTMIQWGWDYLTVDRPIRLLLQARPGPPPPPPSN